MQTIIVKNIDTVSHTYAGQVIESGASYTIQSEAERQSFANDSLLNQHIWADPALAAINNGNEDLSAVLGDKLLKGLPALIDSDGVALSRPKITKTGWHFQLQSVDFQTSNLSSVYNADEGETDLGFASIKCFDALDNELTTQTEADASAVRTEVYWEPTHDYEIIAASIYQNSIPTTDVRMWIIGLPDIPKNLGGTVNFVHGGLNLKNLQTGQLIEIDGRTAKFMAYDAVNHTNKFKVVLRHTAGSKYTLTFVVKLYKSGTI